MPDEAFSQILEPGRELPDHEGVGHDIEVAAHGLIRLTERAANFGVVGNTAMVVREHLPKSPQSLGCRIHAESPDVAFQKRADEIRPPLVAGGIIRCQIGEWEATSLPKSGLVGDAGFIQGKTADFDELDAAGQGLRRCFQEVGRGTAKNKKACR